MLVARGEPLVRLVGNQVRGDQTGAARIGQPGGEPFDAVVLDRIPVGHDQRRDPRRRDRLDRPEHVGDPQPSGERPVGGDLDDRTVHHRVGVWKSDLDDVDTGVHHGLEGVDGSIHSGESGG